MDRRHRHHGRHRRGGRRPNHYSYEDRPRYKKQGGILGFFKRLLGLDKSQIDTTPRQKRTPRPMTGSSEVSSPRFIDEPPQEVNSPKLYVGNLSYETSESDLFDLFSQVGAVHNVEIVRDRQSNSKGFGFVEMQSVETAKGAIEKYHGTEFMGRQLVVSVAKS